MEGWLLFVANLTWTIAYDTYYAMVDRDDDLKIGVKSTAILFGRFDRFIIGVLQGVTLILVVIIAMALHYGWVVYAGIGVCAGLFLLQSYQTRDRERMACFKAFLDNHYVGLILAAALITDRVIFAG